MNNNPNDLESKTKFSGTKQAYSTQGNRGIVMRKVNIFVIRFKVHNYSLKLY